MDQYFHERTHPSTHSEIALGECVGFVEQRLELRRELSHRRLRFKRQIVAAAAH